MTDILKPILIKLTETFGRDYKVYTDRQVQGAKTPCFFVKIISTELDPQFGNLYYMRNLISVTFLSHKEDLYILEDVRFKLLMAMRQIPTCYGVEGRNLQVKIIDDAVVFTGRYDILLEEKEVKPLMEELKLEREVKYGR